ncbi:MAG TPA: phosphotransferase [Solirubrobacteraceae bacterium]|nr:phosphotransferase [Solirubrobacteraceae bacterium]
MEAEPGVLRSPQELTPAWLSAVLGSGAIERIEVERIGTGQMSESRRVRISYAGTADARTHPASVVIKTASEDEASRSTGVGLGVYEREVRFYEELAPRIGGPLAHCHAAMIDPVEGWFTIVLEDVTDAIQGDQIVGCTVADASVAVRQLARLHAPVFADPQLGATPWLNQQSPLNQALLEQLFAGFLERYGERVAPEHVEVCRRFMASADGWMADRRPPMGLVHGDYRLDNLLFGTDARAATSADGGARSDAASANGRRLVAVDWQTVSWGAVMTDAAYFLGGSLATEDRRAHELRLVREYHEALAAEGVRGFDWEECWEGYRRASFLGIVMTVAPAMLVERTERGDEMFLVSLARYAQQVVDLDAIALLPRAGTGRPAPLRPDPADEARHTPGSEQLWNESWYFDAVSADGALGVYTRLGLYPNMGVAWVTAFVCGSDRASVAAIDFEAPLPEGDDLTVERDGLLLTHACLSPLERFAVRLQARGEAHADASALLRGEAGEEVDVGFDLEWTTHGEPYAYRVATRYEIPCDVAGEVRIGDEVLTLRGAGQRDHSWGARDWWSAEWMWSAGRLDDGTSVHGVEFRLPGAPRLGVGYVQAPQSGVLELETVSASEDVAPNGLISRASITYGDLELDVEPIAFGPLLLTAPDGRISQFPRAMCRVRARDGRAGTAWVEWNRNSSLE